MASQFTTFHHFPRLPTELRLKIWSYAQTSLLPTIIPFSVIKSDLDYLRLRRKPCFNKAHIACPSLPIPPLLHASSESRHLCLAHGFYTEGFAFNRMMSTGIDDTDIEVYTSCPHEVASLSNSRSIYWCPSKDIIAFDLSTTTLLEEGKQAYIWGGKTGIFFPRVKQVAMSSFTLHSCALGLAVVLESIDVLWLIVEGWELGREPYKTSAEHLVKRAGLKNADGGDIVVKYFKGSMEAFKHSFVTS